MVFRFESCPMKKVDLGIQFGLLIFKAWIYQFPSSEIPSNSILSLANFALFALFEREFLNESEDQMETCLGDKFPRAGFGALSQAIWCRCNNIADKRSVSSSKTGVGRILKLKGDGE